MVEQWEHLVTALRHRIDELEDGDGEDGEADEGDMVDGADQTPSQTAPPLAASTGDGDETEPPVSDAATPDPADESGTPAADAASDDEPVGGDEDPAADLDTEPVGDEGPAAEDLDTEETPIGPADEPEPEPEQPEPVDDEPQPNGPERPDQPVPVDGEPAPDLVAPTEADDLGAAELDDLPADPFAEEEEPVAAEGDTDGT